QSRYCHPLVPITIIWATVPRGSTPDAPPAWLGQGAGRGRRGRRPRAAISPATFDLRLPSEGGSKNEGATTAAWFVALAIAFALILLAVAFMRLVPERSPELRTRRAG
ncbi:MAG TPA: hypothetical protein VLA90_08225, partial [Actinomycetota bacterium]|nr:hypothetical protein [Actinomycetota bacterium]